MIEPMNFQSEKSGQQKLPAEGSWLTLRAGHAHHVKKLKMGKLLAVMNAISEGQSRLSRCPRVADLNNRLQRSLSTPAGSGKVGKQIPFPAGD